MIERLKQPWLLVGLAILVLGGLTAGCVQLTPGVLPKLGTVVSGGEETGDDLATGGAPQAALVPTPSASASRNLVAVRRGSIAQITSVSGRVVGADETPVAFTQSGKVQLVFVKLGDTVQEGQALLQTDAQEITKNLNAAEAELENANVRLDQAKAQMAADGAARQRDAADRARNDAAQRQAVSLDAQAALHRAQDELARVQAGPSDNDVRIAQAAVTDAQLASQRAEAAVAHAQAGPDPAVLQQDQRDIDDAQNQLDKAQQVLDNLTKGPDPYTLRTYQRDVERAQNALKAAQAVKLDAKATDKDRADRDAAIAAAQLDLQEAQDRLAKLQQPPAAADVTIAQRNVQVAQSKLDAAKQRLAADRSPVDDATLEQLNAQVDNAHLAQQNAEQRLADLQSHPTPDELRAAQDKVAAAQAALNRANQLGTSSSSSSATDANQVGATYNLVLLEKDIARDQALVDSLQQDLESTKLLAPFTGVITSVQVHSGDVLNPGTVVFVLAKPGDPIVRADLSDQDAKLLKVGQTGTFKVDGSNGDPVKAAVTRVSAPSGGHAVAEFKVDWPGQAPSFGSMGQLQVTTQEKTDALLIPKKALRTAGDRTYVQYQDGMTRKIANIEVGITSGTDVEVISGISEGQLVYTLP